MAHLPDFFRSPIWGFAPVFLVISATAILFLREFAFPRAVSAQAANTLPSMSLRPNSYIKDAHIYAGSDQPVPLNPRFVATFVRSGRRARLYVEDRYYPIALMGPHDWIHRPMILLGEIKDFVAGQSIDIPILTPCEKDGRKMWQWGPATETSDPETILKSKALHRGRLTLLVDDGPIEHFYFIIDQAEWETPPSIIGQERFDFIQEWGSKAGSVVI